MLYVLDEPSGRPASEDVGRLMHALQDVKRRQNTVWWWMHDEAMLRARPDQLIEIGRLRANAAARSSFRARSARCKHSDRRT